MLNKNLKTLSDVATKFRTERQCIKYLEKLYWPDGKPISPFDSSSRVYKYENGEYRCKNTQKNFTVTTGTMFEGTKVGLPKWFMAIYLLTNEKKGISSVRLASHIGVSQKTAWLLLHKLRKNFNFAFEDQFKGVCEADETFVGGRNHNRHKDKKVERSQGRSYKKKTPILGILERGDFDIVTRPHKQRPDVMINEKVPYSYSKVRAIVVPNTRRATIEPHVLQTLEPWTTIITDEWKAYKRLEDNLDHHVVYHSHKQYVDYDIPELHSNSIESYWAVLKRSVHGIYNYWSPKHISKYSDEHMWRFNNRGLTSGERFYSLLLNSRRRITYIDLINGRA